MLLRTRRFFALLLLLALPLKGVAGLLMVGCAAMAMPLAAVAAEVGEVGEVGETALAAAAGEAASRSVAATHVALLMPPCHEAAPNSADVSAEPTTAGASGCCHCGPCLAPMAGFEAPPVLAALPPTNAAPVATALLPSGRSADVPRPPPRA